MISKNKEILFLEELINNYNAYLTTDWPNLVYKFIKDDIIEINQFIVMLKDKNVVIANFYCIHITEYGKQYLTKLKERLFYHD